MGEGRNRSILVLEDDDALLGLFGKVLQKSGFEFKAATTVEDAQSLITQRHFDMLVCDLSVAGGARVFDLISSVRAHHPKISVLIITGYTPDEIAARADKLGVEMLDKPFAPADLIKRIAALLDRKAA